MQQNKEQENPQQDFDLASIMDDIRKEQEKMTEANERLIKSLHPDAWDSFIELTEDITSVTDYVSVVDKPKGQNNYEEYGIFTVVYVDQLTRGCIEDDFAGNIYAKIGDTDKWLKIPYDC